MIKKIRRLSILAAPLLLALLTGCAISTPPYSASPDSAQLLKGAPASNVGRFTVKANATGAQSISLRGNGMNSSVGSDYAAYLADALSKELSLAGKLDPKATIEISGELLKNDIAAGGFSTNSGEIEARFVVSNAGQTRYEKVLRSELSWESSFVGAIAIPKAQSQYPVLVQSLLNKLFADKDFVAALR